MKITYNLSLILCLLNTTNTTYTMHEKYHGPRRKNHNDRRVIARNKSKPTPPNIFELVPLNKNSAKNTDTTSVQHYSSPRKKLINAMKTGNLETVTELLCKDARLANTRDSDNNTLIHCAARQGNCALLNFFSNFVYEKTKDNFWFDSYPSFHAKNNLGQTPLDLAIKHGHLEMVKLLIERHQAPVAPWFEKNALEKALFHGQAEIADYLYDLKYFQHIEQFWVGLHDHLASFIFVNYFYYKKAPLTLPIVKLWINKSSYDTFSEFGKGMIIQSLYYLNDQEMVEFNDSIHTKYPNTKIAYSMTSRILDKAKRENRENLISALQRKVIEDSTKMASFYKTLFPDLVNQKIQDKQFSALINLLEKFSYKS